jgi:hypothetical protein
MLSRRRFLLSTLGFSFLPELALPALAKSRKAAPVKAGPHLLSRQAWPPAIVPDHVGITDRNYTCLTDEFGHLAIVDLKRASDAKVVGELTGLGKKIIDAAILTHRAYIISVVETAVGETQPMLTAISLAPFDEPSVLAKIPLEQFSEPTCISAYQDMVAVGGIGRNGENLINFFTTSSKRSRLVQPQFLSALTVDATIVRMDMASKSLVVLESGKTGQLDYISLFYPSSPQLRKKVILDGEYTALARIKDLVVVGGKAPDGPDCQATLVSLEPQPHAVQTARLIGLTDVYDIVLQKNYSALLGQRGTELVFVPLTITKTMELDCATPLVIPAATKSAGTRPRFAAKERFACIAPGAGGAEVVSFDNKTGWQHIFSYNIPHLPASQVACWNDLVVLAAADLKLYDIAKPDKPALLKTAALTGSIRSMVGAGSFVLCLSKDNLSLRKIENISEVITQTTIAGQQVAFDTQKQKAYVISAQGKKVMVNPFSVYANKLEPDTAFEVAQGYRRVQASGGYLCVAGLNDIALYGMGDTPELIGSRHFDNLAIRDVAIADEYLIATAIDKNSKGFLLVLSKDGQELKLLGSTDLKTDGVALAVAGQTAVVVGSGAEGKNLASIFHFSQPSMPNEIASFPVIDAASAVAIKENLAIIVGRGLEILSLS